MTPMPDLAPRLPSRFAAAALARGLAAAALLAVVASLPTSARADGLVRYTVAPMPPGWKLRHTQATAVAAGRMAGVQRDAAALPVDGFVQQDGRAVTVSVPGAMYTWPTAINARATLAGFIATSGDAGLHAFVQSPGEAPRRLFPDGIDRFSEPSAIAADGTVVGWYQSPDLHAPVRAFVWRDGAWIDIPPLAGGTGGVARGINAQGLVVGQADTGPHDPAQAFAWKDGRLATLPPLGAYGADARAVNDHGWIVGGSGVTSVEVHPVLWRDGAVVDLGLPAGDVVAASADAIDGAGTVVGAARLASGPTDVAWVWADGRLAWLRDQVDGLSPDDVLLCRPCAIDEAGRVAVTRARLNANGSLRKGWAVLLLPPGVTP